MRRRGDPAAECKCSPQRLAAFRDKLSRALLDRFDLVVAMPRPRAVELAAAAGRGLRPRARSGSPRRASGSTPGAPQWSKAGDRAARPRGRALAALGPRPREVARVAETIAALAGAGDVGAEHLAEALAYRSPTELGAT